MKDQLRRLDIPFEIFPGVDGDTLSPAQLDYYSNTNSIKVSGRPLSRGEIGCALSHLGVYQLIAERKIPLTLVLEDDVVLCGSFREKILAVSNDCDQWDLVNFITDVDEHLDAPVRLLPGYSHTRFSSHPNRAGAYLLTSSAARRIASQALPIRMPADGLTGNFDLTGIRCRGVFPPLATLRPVKSTFQRGNFPPKQVVWQRKVWEKNSELVLVLNPRLAPSKSWLLWNQAKGELAARFPALRSLRRLFFKD